MNTLPTDWTEGRPAIVLEHCGACGSRWYFRRGFCPRCGAGEVSTQVAGGRGTVYAVTTVVRAPTPEWRAFAPYGIALVDLDEGIRVMTHAASDLSIGERVRIDYRDLGDLIVPYAVSSHAPERDPD
jgi:uncharacterized OB-fold protein